MSAACTTCARLGSVECRDCEQTVKPGELPTKWAPLTMHAVAVRYVAEQNTAQQRAEQFKRWGPM